MIDIRKLKELVRLMVENDLTELNLQDQQETVTVKRGVGGIPMVHAAPAMVPTAAYPAAAQASADASDPSDKTADEPKDIAGLVPVISPMVGTVYLSPNPDSPPFVKAGDSVSPDTTVCLIEAMKVFSEIKAETAGTIERVPVASGQAVQYGQQLMLIRP